MELADATLAAYSREMEAWPARIIARDGGLDSWEARMRSELASPERIRERAATNVRTLKAADLPAEKLLVDL